MEAPVEALPTTLTSNVTAVRNATFLKTETEGNSGFGKPDNTDSLVLLLYSKKDAPISFAAIVSVATVLILLGVLVNGTICFVMVRGKRYRKNTSNFFILHLSVTELVVRLLIFLTVVCLLFVTWEIESVQCKLLRFFSTSFSSAIFLSLVAIAFDRYQNIIYPMKTLKSDKKPVRLVFLVWFCAITVSIPCSLSVKSIAIKETPEAQGLHFESYPDRKLCDISQNAMGQVSTTLYFILAFLIPVAVIFALYLKIAISLHQRSNKGVVHKVVARSKSKAVRMLVVAVLGYVLSLGPSTLFFMMRSYGYLENMSFEDKLILTWVVEFVTLTSSLGNPIIYSYYNGDFRKELFKVIFETTMTATKPNLPPSTAAAGKH